MIDNDDFIKEFIEEASNHIENIEIWMLRLNKDSENTDIVNDIFRSIHSIKGTAGFFALKNIVELAHSMENIFGEIRAKRLSINDKMLDILLECNDCLRLMVSDVIKSENVNISGYIKYIKGFMSKYDVYENLKKIDIEIANENEKIVISEESKDFIINVFKCGHKCYQVKLLLNEDLGKKRMSPIRFFKNIETIGHVIEVYTDITKIKDLDSLDKEIEIIFLFTTVLDLKLAAMALNIADERIKELNINKKTYDFNKEAKQKKNSSTSNEENVKVKVSLLNDLVNLANEMVLSRNQLMSRIKIHNNEISGIEPILKQIDYISNEIQEKIMQTKMQSIDTLFNKFPKVIRELSRKTNKEIELKLEGLGTEVEKSINESLGDSLIHLIRNAVDHGIEKPSEREKIGKSNIGKIILRAYSEGKYLNIEVVDDGAGIDLEKVKKKAIKRGLFTEDELVLMTESEILKIILIPGFSTNENITEISGRGVGMDVVKNNIEKLDGTIEINTSKGKGTTFRLSIPITL